MKYIKLLLGFTVFILSSCSEIAHLSQLPKSDNSFYSVDLGNNEKTHTKIFIKISLNTGFTFNNKSSSGTAAKTKSDLTHIKFYLVESNTGSSPTGALSPVPGSGFVYSVTVTNRSNDSVDLSYINVVPNSTGKSYYIAAAGFSSGTINTSNNITNNSAPAEINNEGKYYISSTGGDITGPGQPGKGSVRIDSSYNLVNNATLPLIVPLKLLDAQPPTITSTVTITDGGL